MKSLIFFFLSILVTGHVVLGQPIVSYTGGLYHVNDTMIRRNINLSGLLSALDTSDLQFYNAAKDIPSCLSEFYGHITGGILWLADPDEDYNCCCTITEGLPYRRLIYFGTDGRMALLSYELGGGFASSRVVLIFKLEDKRIVDFWGGNLWSASSTELDNRDAIVYYLRRYIHSPDIVSGMGLL